MLRRSAIQIYQYNVVGYKIHNIIDKDPIQTHGIVLGVYVKSSLSTCKEELKFNKYLSLYYLLVIIWQLKRNPREKRRESRQHQLRGLEPLRRGRYLKHKVPRKPSNRGASVTRTKKISRRPKKSTRGSRTVSRKERPTGLESTQSSLGPTTRIYESQEVTAFGSTVDERDEDETITTSTVSPSEESDENSNDSSALLD